MDGKLMITGQGEGHKMSNTNLRGQHFQKYLGDYSKQNYKTENNAETVFY